MTDVSRLLAETKTVVVVDWPSREVPDTLARRGFTVIANEGAETYTAYEAHADEVRTRSFDGLPQSAELVYAYRPSTTPGARSSLGPPPVGRAEMANRGVPVPPE